VCFLIQDEIIASVEV